MADSTEPEHELDGEAASVALSRVFAQKLAGIDEPSGASWTCFHCGETFTTVGGARDHFGESPDAQPGCLIRVQLGDERGLQMEVRKLEAQVKKLRAANEQLDYEAGHGRAMEMEIGRRFKNGARSVQDAFNIFDSMEGRALAAEERIAQLEALLNAARPTAGDLLIAAVDKWAQHSLTCTREEPSDCPDCCVLFNQQRLAYKVWQSSDHKAASR